MDLASAKAIGAGIAVIALIGLGLEKLVVAPLGNFTVVRWGMMT